ncbi:MAG: Holliday junction resolvase RuvX [Dehalococcoidia bacterium]
MRTLGLDVGERRIGVAISDPDGRLAVPLRVIERHGAGDAAAIAMLAEREEAGRIVVGLPLSLDGAAGAQARHSEAFAAELKAVTTADVVFYDERFSSAEADVHLRAAGLNTRDARRHRDAVAASIILQAYLDSLRFPPLPPIQ